MMTDSLGLSTGLSIFKSLLGDPARLYRLNPGTLAFASTDITVDVRSDRHRMETRLEFNELQHRGIVDT